MFYCVLVSFCLSAGLVSAIAKGLLVDNPELQSSCLQLIKISLYHSLETNDILALFVKGCQKPNHQHEHQLVLRDPSVLHDSLKPILLGPTGLTLQADRHTYLAAILCMMQVPVCIA